jgi:hypothetical protein
LVVGREAEGTNAHVLVGRPVFRWSCQRAGPCANPLNCHCSARFPLYDRIGGPRGNNPHAMLLSCEWNEFSGCRDGATRFAALLGRAGSGGSATGAEQVPCRFQSCVSDRSDACFAVPMRDSTVWPAQLKSVVRSTCCFGTGRNKNDCAVS